MILYDKNKPCGLKDARMRKLDKAVVKETFYVFIWTFALSAVLNVVFFAFKAWDYKVLCGSLLTAVVAVLNFLLMGIGVQSIVEKKELDEKGRQQRVRLSLYLRMLLIIAALAVGVVVFNPIAAIVPVFFPRVSMLFRAMFIKKQELSPSNPSVEETEAAKEAESEG